LCLYMQTMYLLWFQAADIPAVLANGL
jgi:hypothetical protein